MKIALFLCILTGAVLVLGGCAAEQTTADVSGYGANRSVVPPAVGSLGGGGGGPRNRPSMKNEP